MEGGGAELFAAATGAPREVAARYVESAQGDVDLAVAMYLSEQEEAAGGGEPRAPAGAGAAAGAGAGAGDGASASAAVDSILEGVRARGDRGEAGGGAPGRGGPGQGTGQGAAERGAERGAERSVFVVFFADGFMVDEDFEPPRAEAAEQPAAPAPRRRGMMGLDDLKRDSKARGPLPKLPKLKPLRSYDTPENKAFLADVKAGRVPLELQKRDAQGAPIPVSIALDDVRPKTYEELAKVIKQMESMQREAEGERGERGERGAAAKAPGPALFAGAGNTLSSPGAPAAGAPAGGGAGPGADPALVALASGGAPAVDEARPLATVQLRLASGARVKARLNLDSTVADLWRLVAAEMGAEAFGAASNHQLVAGFPPKPLADASVTIAAADLANAAVTHRCQ